MSFKLRYLIAVFFILNHVLGPGSPFRLLFRTLKPVLFVQVMPVGSRSVRLSVINPSIACGEGKETYFTVSALGAGTECLLSRELSRLIGGVTRIPARLWTFSRLQPSNSDGL